ncbi:MAG TPA: hypothetical protein VLW17_05410 [Thermoanaerobaculaceae bacterium]|nr:hypothetical protein [Thermoanaerobaculaceae bacterium]
MANNVVKSPTVRFVLLTFACALVLVVGFLVGRASAAQPHMVRAREHLQAARSELQAAEADKGGHRVKAIALVNDAIAEVDAGIEFARTR